MLRSFLSVIALSSAAAGCASRSPAKLEFVAPGQNADAPYSDVVRVGDLLFVAGKLGVDPATGALRPGGIQPETRQAMENMREILEENGSALHRIVKCTVFLADIEEWASMNEVYTEFFGSARPARSAVGVSGLGRDARVEIECIAALGT